MTYSNLVEQNRQKFEQSEWLKVISDLAILLDHEHFQIKESASSHDVRPRLNVFNDFCAICVRCDVELPELEKGFFMAHIREKTDKEKIARAASIRKSVKARLKGQRGKDARTTRALAEVLCAFSHRGPYGGADEPDMIAMINFLLAESGLDPIRPDYGDRKVESSKDEKAPDKELSILIIDDDSKEIVKTAHALTGWPSVTVSFLLQKCQKEGWNTLTGEEKENEFKVLAEKVFGLRPDVILMDQGLSRIEGSDLIPAIRSFFEGKEKKAPNFVANTGGSGRELIEAGAYENFEKGMKPKGLRQALNVL